MLRKALAFVVVFTNSKKILFRKVEMSEKYKVKGKTFTVETGFLLDIESRLKIKV